MKNYSNGSNALVVLLSHWNTAVTEASLMLQGEAHSLWWQAYEYQSWTCIMKLWAGFNVCLCPSLRDKEAALAAVARKSLLGTELYSCSQQWES